MNNLTKWNFENSEVRTLTIENEPYFVGKDVATVLGYSNPRKALLDHIDEEDKLDGGTIRDSIGREQNPVFTVLSYQVSYRLQRNLRDG